MLDERCHREPLHRLGGVDVRVLEGLDRPPRLHPEFRFEFGLQSVLGDELQAAVGVVDQDDLAGAEVPL